VSSIPINIGMNKLYAHHKDTHTGGGGKGNGKGNGNGNKVPEIDGDALPLGILFIVLFFILLKSYHKRLGS
jgi:hypothetical protein